MDAFRIVSDAARRRDFFLFYFSILWFSLPQYSKPHISISNTHQNASDLNNHNGFVRFILESDVLNT